MVLFRSCVSVSVTAGDEFVHSERCVPIGLPTIKGPRNAPIQCLEPTSSVDSIPFLLGKFALRLVEAQVSADDISIRRVEKKPMPSEKAASVEGQGLPSNVSVMMAFCVVSW